MKYDFVIKKIKVFVICAVHCFWTWISNQRYTVTSKPPELVPLLTKKTSVWWSNIRFMSACMRYSARVFIELDFVYIPISCGGNLKWQLILICTRVAFISEETAKQNLPSYTCMYLWLYLVLKRLGIVHTYAFYMMAMFKHNFTKYCEKIMLYKMQWIIQII